MPGEWWRPRQPQPRTGAQAAGGSLGAELPGWPGCGGGLTALTPAQTEGGCSRCPSCPALGSARAASRGGRARSLRGAWHVWSRGPSQAPRPPIPLPPRCRGAGDWLTPICGWWEPHCSGAVYCIRGMLASNQLSGRPSPDLIPTLARLCACSACTGGLAGQDPDNTPLGQTPPAGRWCLRLPQWDRTGTSQPRRPGWWTEGGPAARGTPISSPRRGAALWGGVHVGEEELGLVQVWVGGSTSQLPSPAVSAGTLPAPRSCSWSGCSAMQSAAAAATSSPASAGQGMCVGPSPTLCYCLWLPALCREKGR